ncbi:PREDICTED: uncharacterized protein LOC104823333 isoform X2 [Tarenaya hassleriana]|uniref:uncharacterized protein LOC104823333 isoform X2 n=1 Tax=Tarenaya hassleriana TaxID=28532 RepID=UPI00053C401F|nr:PREDICTED: uncharacterized protein LOC104823333 isoform X2 [Tarenaya hassleriana]
MIVAVRENWLARAPAIPLTAVRGSVRRNPSSRLGFLLSNGPSRGVALVGQAVHGEKSQPYEVLPTGKRAYIDEADVVTFLDPPKELIPLDPASYNPAAYLWKKIEDIPEERRHRLLQLLEPRLISRAWQISSARYEDPKLAKKTSSKLLSAESSETSLEYFNCRTSQGPFTISWINSFRMAVFRSNSGRIFGRISVSSLSPLYFKVTDDAREVMSTEEPCDVALEFGDGLLGVEEHHPQGFPQPRKHPYPFSDNVVIYVRHIGPGVCVGQAWQEGVQLHQLPRKLSADILFVKQFT